MLITLKRYSFDVDSTIGKLYIDGVFECYTLEDKVRADGVKIAGATAIPAGRYEVIINYSNRFKRLMPLLLNVLNFIGIRIHWGNKSKDTEGCLLLGQTVGKDFIGHSVDAFNAFFTKLQVAKGAVFIEISNEATV